MAALPATWQKLSASIRASTTLCGCQSGSSVKEVQPRCSVLSSASTCSNAVSHGSLVEQIQLGSHGGGWRRLEVLNVGWDPEGILGAPVVGHIARRSAQKSLAEVEAERAEEERRRRAAREARVVPDEDKELVEYFLDTDVSEMKFEVARCRPRLTDGFLATLRGEMGELRFAKVLTDVDQDRLAELEALEASLKKEIEDYDKQASEFLSRRAVLEEILVAKDKKACLLELAAKSQLDLPLLALLDHNIATAAAANQEKVHEFMTKLRAGVVKYMTV